MGLREQAAADAQAILEDQDGFGWPVQLIDPQGNVADLTGFSNDIAQTIDPETGQAVSGRVATLSLSLRSIDNAILDMPKNVSARASKPWVVRWTDLQGKEHTFKVREHIPDRALGVVVLVLETHVTTP